MKRLSDSEITSAADAKKYLYSELSLVQDIPFEEVETYIEQYVEKSF
jgi:hypothetical protein